MKERDVSPASEWRKSPYFGRKDPFWQAVTSTTSLLSPKGAPLFLTEDTDSGHEALISPSSVLRFRIERGDFPYCYPQFKAFSNPPFGWQEWVDDVLSDKSFCQRLQEARLLIPVKISRSLSIRRNNASLEAMALRWSTETHTFILGQHEMGPTLEDVFMLLRLEVTGPDAFDPEQTPPEDDSLIQSLKLNLQTCGRWSSIFDGSARRTSRVRTDRASYTAWIRHFFKDLQPLARDADPNSREYEVGPMYDSRLYFLGFLACFLSFFILPSTPPDSLNPFVFPLAVRLFRGDRIPLAPLFLGNLYYRLDLLHRDMVRSVGRYEPVSFIHSQFLLCFFFERFPKFAPAPTVFEAEVLREIVDKDGIPVLDTDGSRTFGKAKSYQPLITRWSRTISTLSLNTLVDDPRRFVARPYVCPPVGVATPLIYHGSSRSVSFPLPKNIPAPFVDMLIMIRPSSLPVWHEEGVDSAVYRPDRVACQFGFDQCATGPAPPLLSFSASYGRFSRGLIHTVLPISGSLTVPGLSRVGGFTSSFRRYWQKNIDAFIAFVQSRPTVCLPPPIYKKDSSLRLLESRKSDHMYESFFTSSAPTDPSARASASSLAITSPEPVPLNKASGPRTTRLKKMAHKRASDASPSASRLSKRLHEDPAVVDVLSTVAPGHAASPRPDSDLDDTLPLSARLVKMRTPRIAVIDDDDDEAESSDHFCDLIPRTRRHRPTVAEEERYLGDEVIGAHRSDVEITGGTDATEIDVAGHASRSDVEMRCASGNGVEVDVLEISETRSGTYGDSHPPALLPSSGMTATVQASSDIEIDQVVSTRPSDFVDARSPSVAPALHIDSPSVLAATGVLPSPASDSAPVLAATVVPSSPAPDSTPTLFVTPHVIFHIGSDAFGLSPYHSAFSGSGPLPGVTPPGGSSNPIDIGEIPETSSFPAPIPPSASGKVSFLHYWVAPEFASVLQLVHSSYPETFASFACQCPLIQTALLESFATILYSLDRQRLCDLNGKVVETAYQGISDMERHQVDLSWLRKRLDIASNVSHQLELMSVLASYRTSIDEIKATLCELESGYARALETLEAHSTVCPPDVDMTGSFFEGVFRKD
ncbi:hypothetical protein HYC85_029624 [Camellia sinensis]|uniref:Aminotransferase-like plant mobile domain-containing protein n=1 Tax=Camellia sinensis TaxID=4442 RepID=A0A7J7FYF3_CAMSI|nr:hypothetical protein HYC85_029624 [Camellia sinensis]